jgi:hypothetical protein
MSKSIRPQLLQHTAAVAAWNTQPGQQNQTGPSGSGGGDNSGQGGSDGGTGGSGTGDNGAGNGAGDQGGKQGDPAGDLGPGGVKALQTEREARAEAERLLKEAREELANSKLTEQQRIEKAAEDARNDAASKAEKLSAADQVIARYEAAEKAGLSLAMAKRLVGNTAAELEADAKAFAETLPRTGRRTPAADPSQGLGGDRTRAGGSVAAAKEEHLARAKK